MRANISKWSRSWNLRTRIVVDLIVVVVWFELLVRSVILTYGKQQQEIVVVYLCMSSEIQASFCGRLEQQLVLIVYVFPFFYFLKRFQYLVSALWRKRKLCS